MCHSCLPVLITLLAAASRDCFAFREYRKFNLMFCSLDHVCLLTVFGCIIYQSPQFLHLVNKGLFLAPNASCWRAMLSTLLTQTCTATQHWSIRFKMFHIPSWHFLSCKPPKKKKDQSVLCWRLLHLFKPFSLLPFDVVCRKTKSTGLFYGPFTSYQKQPCIC